MVASHTQWARFSISQWPRSSAIRSFWTACSGATWSPPYVISWVLDAPINASSTQLAPLARLASELVSPRPRTLYLERCAQRF